MSSSDESGISQPISSSSTLPDKERHTERVLSNRGFQEFLVVDHTANLRKNAKISPIWHHGGERRRLDDNSMAKYWRCIYCTGRPTVLKVDGNGGQTTYALSHLKNKHNIDCKADDSAIPSTIASFSATDEEDDHLGPDEFQKFICATPTTVAKNDIHWNPINWWIEESQKGNYDTLHLYALDHLSCPAMATQCERVFSAARRTLTPERNALGLKVLEACECLRWWWRNGVVTGRLTAGPITPRVQIEAQFVTALLGDAALDEEDVE